MRPLISVVCILVMLGIPPQGQADPQKLQVGEITISYPAEFESQANELARAATEVLPPIRDRFTRIQRALSDPKAAAKQIADLMGCPDRSETPRKILSAFQAATTPLSGLFTDLRLYKDSELMATGGLTEGLVHLVYDPKADDFNLRINAGSGQGASDKAFMPFPIRSDGSLRTKGMSLGDFLADQYERLPRSALAPIHEAAEGILVRDLSFVHPFSRWFNEGVSTWVMLKMAEQVVPSVYSVERANYVPQEPDMQLKGKVNLLSWPLSSFQPAHPSPEEQALSQAHYVFAEDAVDRMLRDRPGALAKIIPKLEGGEAPDTDKICAAIREVTGRDAKAILLDYVPDFVRAGLKDGEPESLRKDALEKLHRRDFAGGAKLLSRLLEMTPSNVNARLDLAWAMRKSVAAKPESERMIAIAAGVLIAAGVWSFGLTEEDAESSYVAGRVLELMDDREQAGKLFQHVLEADPNHADAQAALKELEGESPK